MASQATSCTVSTSDEGKLTFQIDTEATKPPLLERTGIDLDETGSAATNYTVVTRLYPQADTKNTVEHEPHLPVRSQ